MAHLLCGYIDGEFSEFKLILYTKAKETNIFNAKYPTNYFASLEECLDRVFLKLQGYPIQYVSVGIAGPKLGADIKITNCRWPKFNIDALKVKYSNMKIEFLNDFEAAAHGLLALNEELLVKVNNVLPTKGGSKIIIGAGVGLGECFLTQGLNSVSYSIFATEGGHTDFTPRTVLEYGFMEYVKEFLDLDRVSMERCISRSGLPLLYGYLKETLPHLVSPLSDDNSNVNWKTILEAGISGKDQVCAKTVEMFISLFGSEVGNFALKILPYGGIYLMSDLVMILKEKLITEKTFMNGFLNKGRMRCLLEKMPIYILESNVGLIGAKEYALKWLAK